MWFSIFCVILFLFESLFCDSFFQLLDSGGLPNSGKVRFLTSVNIRRPASINGNVVGQYTAGETLVYDTKFLNESRTWISYIGDSGNRNYCCAVDSNGSWYVELVVSPNNSCPINNPAEGNGKSDVNYGQYEALYYHGTPALHWMGTPTGGSRGNKCCWLCNQGCTVLSYLYWKKITPNETNVKRLIDNNADMKWIGMKPAGKVTAPSVAKLSGKGHWVHIISDQGNGMWKIFDPSGHKTATVNTSYFDASKVYIDDPTKPGPFDQAEIGGSIGGSDGDGDGDSAEDGEDNPAQPTGDKCWDDEMQDGNAGKKTRRTLAMALVLGGVGGAVVVTAVIVGFVIFLVRRKRRGYDSISDKNVALEDQ